MSLHPLPQVGHTAWGVDRIRFGFDVEPAECDLSSSLWSTSRSQNLLEADEVSESFTGTFQLGHANVHVGLYLKNSRCLVEFNPSRAMSPKGVQLLPPDLLSSVISTALDEIRQAAWPVFDTVTQDGEILRDPQWEARVLIKRLDLARNFRTSIPEAIKSALESKDARYQKSKHQYSRTDGGWGIENSTKSSGHDVLYDKTAELGSTDLDPDFDSRLTAEERVLRFETQMRAPRLKEFRLNRLNCLTPQACWGSLTKRWDATNWGTPIATGGDIYNLMRSLPYAERAALIGYLMLKANGAETGISAYQERRMRRLAKQHGLTPGVPIVEQGQPDSYLNISTGELEPWHPAEATTGWSEGEESAMSDSEVG